MNRFLINICAVFIIVIAYCRQAKAQGDLKGGIHDIYHQSRFGRSRDSVANLPSTNTIKPPKVLRPEWGEGRIPEFSNAYTLHRHELRLNIFGPSSYAISDKVELKSYLSAVVVPNFSIKKKFYDKGSMAFAWEAGAAIGVFPLAVASGLLLPGAALAGGTVGLVTFNSLFVKGYGSWKPSKKFTFSLRSEVARVHIGYSGLGGFAAIGDGGGGVAVIPISSSVITEFWLAGGFETDYVINPKQAIVLKASIGKTLATNFLNDNVSILARNYLLLPSLTWNHTWEHRHIHLSLGLFGTYNPPAFTMTQKAVAPVMYYYNVYWIFNNRIRQLK